MFSVLSFGLPLWCHYVYFCQLFPHVFLLPLITSHVYFVCVCHSCVFVILRSFVRFSFSLVQLKFCSCFHVHVYV